MLGLMTVLMLSQESNMLCVLLRCLPYLTCKKGLRPLRSSVMPVALAWGSVLMQAGRPIAFDGTRLSPAEQNYHVGEQELLAVIHALELWRCYLDNQIFVVVTDHSPNTFFADKKVLSPRQTRWAERLSRFQFTWEYQPGRVNVADPLSRHPAFEATTALSSITLDLSCLTLSSIDGAMLSAVVTRGRTAPPPSPAAQHTRTNVLDSTAPAGAQHTCTDMSDSSVPATVPAETDHIAADVAAENAEAATADADMLSQLIRGYSADSWFASARNTATLDIYQGLYYRGDALVIPDISELRHSIMQELHGANYSGHVGYHRTIQNVNRMYWWPGMAADIQAFVQGCKTCQEDKSLQTHPAGKLVSTPIPKQPWDHVTMDRIVSLPKTKKGHTAILVVIDKLNKMAHFAPCKNESTARDLASE